MSDSGLDRFILDQLEKLDNKLDQVRLESTKLTEAFKQHEKKDEDIHKDVRDMAAKFTAQLDAQCEALKKYNAQLEEHMKRSDLLEKSHEKMWERVKPVVDKYEEAKIVEKVTSDKWKKWVKISAAVGTVAGAIYTVMKLLDLF